MSDPNPSAPTDDRDNDTTLDPRLWSNGKATAQATKAAHARAESGRRRLVDPATCERDYSAAELEFMLAMQDYKKASGRMFPTWSEVLEVLRSLGYRKQSTEGSDRDPTPFIASAS
jgi:hypothetical protein